MNTVKIYNAKDEFEAQMLVEVLEENDIPCYSMNSDVGEYMKITQGFSIFGMDLYVDEKDEAEAKRLVKAAIDSATNAMDEEFANSDEDVNYELPWYRNRVVLARLLLAWAVISGLVILILGR